MEPRLLVEAAFSGDLVTVQQLINAGWDVNAQYFNGVVTRTALDNAIENQRLDVLRYLLENGALLNRHSEFGTPLHHALDIELEEPNWHDENGDHRHPKADITRILIEFGADVNIRCEGGMTPLDMAIAHKHHHAEELLREHGAVTS